MSRIVLGISVVLLLAGLVGCQTPQLKERIADQERMIRQLQQEKSAVEGRLRTTTGELSEAQARAESERSRAQSLETELAGLRSEAARPAAAQDGLDSQRRELERLLQGSGGSVEVRDGNLVISLPGTITFGSGSAKLTSRGEGILKRIVNEIRSQYGNRTISVEGHTDDDPIRKSKFETNWRLSVERAMAVRDYLENSAGVGPDRFRVVGYGPFRPVASNGSAAGKEKNRRVEIVIVNS